MHIVLTGATGLVGSAVLHHILSLSASIAAKKKITQVDIISRKTDIPLLQHPLRPRNNNYTKINVIRHDDFKTFPSGLVSDDGKIGVIWALGISQSQVSEKEYVEITRNYPVTAAESLARSLSDAADLGVNGVRQVNFVYVSGEGATHHPGLMTPLFGKTKGHTELDLLKLGRETGIEMYMPRPAGIDELAQSVVHDCVKEKLAATGLGPKFAKSVIFPLLRAIPGLNAAYIVPTEELGSALVELCGIDGPLTGLGVEEREGEGRVIKNAGLRRLYKESCA